MYVYVCCAYIYILLILVFKISAVRQMIYLFILHYQIVRTPD